MQTPMDDAGSAATSRTRGSAVGQLAAEWWWLWLVMGIVWILLAVIVLQFHTASLVTVGIVVGILFILAGLQEFAVAYVSGGWRWLWYAIGILLVIAGIWALFNPVGTFVALADTLGFLFVLFGAFWIVEAFATAAVNPVWWLGLISGVIMVILGFWASGQFFATRAYTLLLFAGIWMLLHGVSDLVKAFQIRKVGAMIAG
jgi:uncharacterized membrane protein HdeD (DUF308 family)